MSELVRDKVGGGRKIAKTAAASSLNFQRMVAIGGDRPWHRWSSGGEEGESPVCAGHGWLEEGK